MRSGAAAGWSGYFHEAAFYATDDELVELAAPFVAEGVAAGEPVIVSFDVRNAALLRGAVGDLDGVRYLEGSDRYSSPAVTIRGYQELFSGLVKQGAAQIRVVGDVPHPGTGIPWHSWARYEIALNEALDAYPLWGLCTYDLRTTPPAVVELVEACHTHVADDHVHRRNELQREPGELRRELGAPQRYPVERSAPREVLVDPPLRAGRAFAARVAEAALLSPSAVSDLQVACSEVLTNAIHHGAAPVVVSGWAEPGRAVVEVRDHGHGIADPLAGLIADRRPLGRGGLGLWLAHQMCADVTMHRDERGFAVRLVAGRVELD